MDAGEATSRVHTRGIDWIFQFSKGPKEPLERALFFFFSFTKCESSAFHKQNKEFLPFEPNKKFIT